MQMRRAMTALGVTGLASAFLVLSPLPSGADSGKSARMLDDCEATSFNAALNDKNACVGDGETTFGQFATEVSSTHQVEKWRYKDSMLKVEGGRPVFVENRGGETHTFTMVAAFGGGFVPFLNNPSEQLAPECATGPADDPTPVGPGPRSVFVSANSTAAFQTAGLAPGTYLFQCCIHPWMRITLTVE